MAPYSPDLFDEYTRRQFVTRAPTQNPFGTDETPAAFNEFDVFTKARTSYAHGPVLRCTSIPVLTPYTIIDSRASTTYSVGDDKPSPDSGEDG